MLPRHESRRCAWLLVALSICLNMPGVLADEKTPVFTEVAAIRNLLPEEAARAAPVRVEGIVAFVRPEGFDFFLNDGGTGIYVAAKESGLRFYPGQRVRVTGVTGPGAFAPIIQLREGVASGSRPAASSRR
jgi:hypothetical protein